MSGLRRHGEGQEFLISLSTFRQKTRKMPPLAVKDEVAAFAAKSLATLPPPARSHSALILFEKLKLRGSSIAWTRFHIMSVSAFGEASAPDDFRVGKLQFAGPFSKALGEQAHRNGMFPMASTASMYVA